MLLSVQRPDIPEDMRADYRELAEYGCRSVQELVMGIRAFFRTAASVRDHVHKVTFWEREADTVGERLKRKIFSSDLDLARKMHLGDFVVHVDTLADDAEDVNRSVLEDLTGKAGDGKDE